MSGTYPFCIGLELTWLPKKRGTKWQEFRDKEEAQKVAEEFNRFIRLDAHIGAAAVHYAIAPFKLFVAKADTFRSLITTRDVPNTHEAWCIEINSYPLPAADFFDKYSYTKTSNGKTRLEETSLAAALESLYLIAKSLGLHPCVIRKTKDNTLLESPTGGGHLHVSTDFWLEGASYLASLYHFERAICLDFTNHPFIRWLFCQWMDDINSGTSVKYDLAKRIQKQSRPSCPKKIRISQSAASYVAHDQALNCHSIKQRMSYVGKPIMPTYEFRFFDMPRSVKELQLQVKFLSKWVSYWTSIAGARKADSLGPDYTLTPAYYLRLTKDLDFAYKEISTWFNKIGLDFAEYKELCWDRAYVRRMKYNRPK